MQITKFRYVISVDGQSVSLTLSYLFINKITNAIDRKTWMSTIIHRIKYNSTLVKLNKVRLKL